MAMGERMSPRYVELLVDAYKRLKKDKRCSPNHVWAISWETDHEDWLKGYTRKELEQAFHDLGREGFAKPISSDYYEITDQGEKSTPGGVADYFLSSLAKDIGKDVAVYRSRGRIDTLVVLLFFFGMFAIFVFGASFLYAQSVLMVLIAAGAAVYGLRYASDKLWQARELSQEKVIFVELLGAYDKLIKGNRSGAHDTAKAISKRLETRGEVSARWSTLSADLRTLANIGRDIRIGLEPALLDEKRTIEELGEVLTRLSCIFLGGTPQDMWRAREIYKGMLPKEEREAKEVKTAERKSVASRVRSALALRPVHVLVAFGLAGSVVFIPIWVGTLLSKTVFEPTPSNIAWSVVSIFVVAGVVVAILSYLSKKA